MWWFVAHQSHSYGPGPYSRLASVAARAQRARRRNLKLAARSLGRGGRTHRCTFSGAPATCATETCGISGIFAAATANSTSYRSGSRTGRATSDARWSRASPAAWPRRRSRWFGASRLAGPCVSFRRHPHAQSFLLKQQGQSTQGKSTWKLSVHAVRRKKKEELVVV